MNNDIKEKFMLLIIKWFKVRPEYIYVIIIFYLYTIHILLFWFVRDKIIKNISIRQNSK